ncbi:peptidoglycan-recognition protein SC2-like [Ornithodoros turicata]|uniref:peptidoglycan-recognition protein SC2-like n=1 Tax=Ornithodoros turicata TaxID=34597 RepID=UPI0031398ABC
MECARVFGVVLLVSVAAQAAAQCPGVEIVPRSGWGAKKATSVKRMPNPVARYVFIHHTTGAGCNSKASCSRLVRGYQSFHMGKGWSDIGYNFLIGGDGRVYTGRSWGVVGAHTVGYNSNGVAFSFIGDYSGRAPDAKMLNTAKKLLACGVSKGHISKNYSLHGHRDANPTSCPGNRLYNIIKTWPRFRGSLRKG